MHFPDIDQMTAQELLETYRDLKIEIQPTIDFLTRLEKIIKRHIVETGEIVEVEGAKTRISRGYIRSAWDNKGLRGYALNRPEILQFLKETEVGPSVRIKLG